MRGDGLFAGRRCRFRRVNVSKLMDRPQFGVYGTQSGVDMTKNPSLANALFSGVQQRVLGLIFGNPERSFYTSEIVRSVRSGRGAVERELARLEQTGLISAERIGNQKHYRANRASPIFEELHGIVLKTVGLTEPLKQSLAPYADKIRGCFRLWFSRERHRYGAQRHRSHGNRRRPDIRRSVCGFAEGRERFESDCKPDLLFLR